MRIIENTLIKPGYRRTVVEVDEPTLVHLKGDDTARGNPSMPRNWAMTSLGYGPVNAKREARILAGRLMSLYCHWFIYIIHEGQPLIWYRSLARVYQQTVDDGESLVFYPPRNNDCLIKGPCVIGGCS